MDILFNLFEFYNLGFFVGFLFLNVVNTKVKYAYIIAYFLLAEVDRGLRQLEVNGVGIEKIYRWLFNCGLTTIGLLVCESLRYNNLYLTINLKYFHTLVFIFGTIQCLSQVYNYGDNITINFVHLYLRVMFVITMLLEVMNLDY